LAGRFFSAGTGCLPKKRLVLSIEVISFIVFLGRNPFYYSLK